MWDFGRSVCGGKILIREVKDGRKELNMYTTHDQRVEKKFKESVIDVRRQSLLKMRAYCSQMQSIHHNRRTMEVC